MHLRENPPICNWPGGGITPADKQMRVDHIEPSQGLDDPKRLDASRVQWLCKPHHDRKTREDTSYARYSVLVNCHFEGGDSAPREEENNRSDDEQAKTDCHPGQRRGIPISVEFS